MLTATALAVLATALVLGYLLLPLQRRFVVPPPQQSAILVTGVSSGLGSAFARDLAALGFLVFGTVRKQADADALQSEGIIRPVLLDVGNAEQFPAALAHVKAVLDREGRSLCGLVNNAGITGMENTRATPEKLVGPEHYERVMSTNVLGVVRATEAFLPLLKECRGGGARVVNIGSYFGDLAPGKHYLAQYVASKFAVEGLSDVWRRAMRPSGIAVSLVKPGDFSTKMNPLPSASSDLSPVVGCVRDAVTSPQPLARYYAGKVQGVPVAVLCRLLNAIPDVFADMIVQ
jgi:NAD(P)-dependent dehydrogenase (short-subunit alcohol dehydrogenase family)